MPEGVERATDSSRTILLTAAGIVAAIMMERLIGRMGELSDGSVIWGSSGTVLAQGTLIMVSIANWWVFYATVTSVGRWVLTPLDLLGPLIVGALALLTIENIAAQVQTEFLAVITIVWIGAVVLDRTVVAGMRNQEGESAALFDHYPDRSVEGLFFAAAAVTGAACLLNLVAEPSAFLTNTLILIAAALDAGIVFLQLNWWSRATRNVGDGSERPG